MNDFFIFFSGPGPSAEPGHPAQVMEVPAMRNRWALLFVVMHVAGFGGAATAQTVDQQQCFFPPGPGYAGIDCWTAVIQSGRETPENLAKAFLTRGLLYALKGELDRAIDDYDQVVQLNPNNAGAYHLRGIAYRVKGQLDHAIQDYDQAIRLNPNAAPAYFGRASAYDAIGQLDRAIQDFDQGIRLNPNNAVAFSNRGAVYARRGQPDRAIEDYASRLRNRPRQRAPEESRSAGAVRIDRADAAVSRRVSGQQPSEAGAGSVSRSRRPRSISDGAAVRAPAGAVGCKRRS
jgi:Tfp pilus assembly protein PilF